MSQQLRASDVRLLIANQLSLSLNVERLSSKNILKPPPSGWPRIASALYYEDAAAAIDWLCRAFGFEVRVRIEGPAGSIEHSELTYGTNA